MYLFDSKPVTYIISLNKKSIIYGIDQNEPEAIH